jgi:hypothetical protein
MIRRVFALGQLLESLIYDDVAKLKATLQIPCIGPLLRVVGFPSALGAKSEAVDD